jgi:hypothetical protein
MTIVTIVPGSKYNRNAQNLTKKWRSQTPMSAHITHFISQSPFGRSGQERLPVLGAGSPKALAVSAAVLHSSLFRQRRHHLPKRIAF